MATLMKFLCPNGHQLSTSVDRAGKPGQCPKCGVKFLVPEADDADEADADADDADFVIQAKYRIAHTFGFPSPSSTVDLELGVAAASEFIAAYPTHELAPQAELEIAQSFLNRGRQEDGVARLRSLIANAAYAESDVIPQARYLLGAALAGQGNAAEAIVAWKEFLEKHPTSPRWSEVQQAIVDAEFSAADDQLLAGSSMKLVGVLVAAITFGWAFYRWHAADPVGPPRRRVTTHS